VLVTGGADGSVRIWRLLSTHQTVFDPADKLPRRPLPPAPAAIVHCHAGAVGLLAVSEGLDAGVSSSVSDGVCAIFSLSTGRLTRVFRHPTQAPVHLLALAQEGVVVVYSRDDGALHLFDINGQLVASTCAADGQVVTALTLSPDGLLLFAGAGSGHVYIYRVPSLVALTSFPPPVAAGRVDSIALSPCNNFLLCGFAGGAMSVYTSEAQIIMHLKKSLQDLGIGEGGIGAL
jgi:WD40 repeat protein